MSGAENVQSVPGRKFLVRWRVKNFSMFGTKRDQSERSKTFEVPLFGDTKWYLKLLVEELQERNIMCFLCRDDDGPENVKSFYSISVGSSYVEEQHTFARKSSCIIPGIISQHKFNDDVRCGLCRDLLEIECYLWPDSTAEVPTPVIPYPVGIKMVTTVPKEEKSVVFGLALDDYQEYEPQEFKITLQSPGWYRNDSLTEPYSDFGGFVMEEGEALTIHFDDDFNLYNIPFVLKFNAYLLDGHMNKLLLAHSKAVSRQNFPMQFLLSMPKKELLKYRDNGDEVPLYFEFIYSFNINITTFIDHTLYDKQSDLQVNQEFKWGLFLVRKYNEHFLFFRLLALLAVVFSVLLKLIV